jgi:subtilisin family serine protease
LGSRAARILWLWMVLSACGSVGLIAPQVEGQEFVSGQLLVRPKASLSEADFSRRIQKRGAVHQRTLHRSRVRVLAVKEEQTDMLLADLRADPEIEFAERDYIARACMTVNDPYVLSGSEWHLTKIQAPQAWDAATGVSNVVIAVLDSGINSAHPDLAGRILPGYDFVNNTINPADDFGHGTAVAGTVAAEGNNGVGVAGVAFGCMVLPVKVMDATGAASHSTIAQGIEYAIQQGARIINLSLGGDWSSSTLQNAINDAWSNHVVVVAAAGNNGGTTPQYPGACDHVLAVAASEPDDSRAWFSSYGAYVTLFAPGDTIWTTQRDLYRPYAAWSGTSFSSPVVAGVAALMLSVEPSLSNTQVVDVLKQTADDLGPIGYDSTFAYGRVNAFRAVSAVNPEPAKPTSSLPPAEPTLVPPMTGSSSSTVSPPDLASPSLAITNAPPNGARLASPAVRLSGRASDSVGLDHVEVIVNDGPIQRAAGTTNWDAQVMLAPGYNLVRVRSVDLAGNFSPEVSRRLTYVTFAALTVQTNGLGQVSPDLSGAQLEIGRTYRLRASPGPGQLFAGWSGGVASPAPGLSFTMRSNLAVVANFAPNPFPAVRGAYAGIMANTNGITPDNSGYFSLALGSFGAFSGRVLTAGKRFGFSGRFDLAGNASVNVRRGLMAPLALVLNVDLVHGSDQVAGSVGDGNWISGLIADRNVFNFLYNPAQQAGLRAFILQRAPDNSTAADGLSRISLSGRTNVRGQLSDGRTFSASSALAKNGDCPIYLSLNRGSEMVLGWLNFGAGQGPTASGSVLWVKTGTNAFAATLQAAPAPQP